MAPRRRNAAPNLNCARSIANQNKFAKPSMRPIKSGGSSGRIASRPIGSRWKSTPSALARVPRRASERRQRPLNQRQSESASPNDSSLGELICKSSRSPSLFGRARLCVSAALVGRFRVSRASCWHQFPVGSFRVLSFSLRCELKSPAQRGTRFCCRSVGATHLRHRSAPSSGRRFE